MTETHSKIGRVNSESVHKGTGKNWDQWIAILEKVGARSWTHQEIVAFLKKKYKLRPWWQQGVTHGFEVFIGRRVDGQNAKGEYSLIVTKSLHVDAKVLWKFITSEEGQKIWLKPLFASPIKPKVMFETEEGYFGEYRTIKKERRIRMTWQDPNWDSNTYVQITLVPRPKEKSILAFDQGKIKDLRIQAKMRARWRSAADEIYLRLKTAD